MEKYIGTKLIEAEPAFRVSNEGETPKVVTDFGEAKDYQTVDMGYRVRYADGYESWSPANVFERAYLKMTVNPHLKTDKPSISQEMVDDFIVAAEVTTMGDKCTVVRAVLRNGFEIVESSACVSAENYDEKLGADICMEKIKDKVWFLLGFPLQTAVHGVDGAEEKGETVQEKVRSGMSFGQAIEEAKKGYRITRNGWNGKGMYVFLADDVEFATDADISEFDGKEDGVEVLPMLVMRTAQGKLQPGWLASQSDMLAEDWAVVW